MGQCNHSGHLDSSVAFNSIDHGSRINSGGWEHRIMVLQWFSFFGGGFQSVLEEDKVPVIGLCFGEYHRLKLCPSSYLTFI